MDASREVDGPNAVLPGVSQSLDKPSATDGKSRTQDDHKDLLALLSKSNPQQPPAEALENRPASGAVLRYGARSLDLPLALKSNLFAWSRMKFSIPKFDGVEVVEDPLSNVGAARACRLRRNARVLREAESLLGANKKRERSGTSIGAISPTSGSSGPGVSRTFGSRKQFKLEQSVIIENDSQMTSLLLFHPFESMLVVADEKDSLTVWNFEDGEQLIKFSNKNSVRSRLTSLQWMNGNEESLLLAGSDDGVVRCWHGLHDIRISKPPSLLTAFNAVPDLEPGTRGSGLVAKWQQQVGLLYAGGNSTHLRVWDLSSEKLAVAVPTGLKTCVTALTADDSQEGLIVAGSGDGSIRLYDRRIPPEGSLVCSLNEHRAWVVNTHITPGTTELLSGCVTGEIKFWDLRVLGSSIKTVEAHRSPMTAMAVHNYAPVIASGSHNQFIKIFNMDGDTLGMIRYHEGFLGQRIGPVSCLAFHPHKLYLAAGATDSIVSVYSHHER